MKKVFTLLVALVLLLSACASGTNNPSTGGNAEGGNQSGSSGSNSNTGEEDPFKVVLLIPGTLGDKSFFDSANRGLEMVREQFGAETKVIEMGTDVTKWEPTYRDVAGQDWDLIISGNSTASEYYHAVAAEYPDKVFIDFDTEFEEIPDNMYAMTYQINGATFLAGAAAALATSSDLPGANPERIISFIGGLDAPGINAFLVGFIEGAQYVDPEVKVITSYAGTFTDPAKGKEIALAQYNSGSDVIFGAAGSTGLGIFDAAKETRKYAIGVDSDQALMLIDTDLEKANLIITSAMKNIDQSIYRAVDMYLDGELELGVRETLGFNEGGVGISKNAIYDQLLTDDMRRTIEEIEFKLIDGEITVSDAMLMNTTEVEALRNAVAP